MSGHLDWITLSPKKTGLPLEDIYKEASELKVIVFNNNDFKFAEEQSAKVSDNCKRYLQSEWSREMKCTLRLRIIYWNIRNGRLLYRLISI
jgi:hypothetical protein